MASRSSAGRQASSAVGRQAWTCGANRFNGWQPPNARVSVDLLGGLKDLAFEIIGFFPVVWIFISRNLCANKTTVLLPA
jgi:hypothetical protein